MLFRPLAIAAPVALAACVTVTEVPALLPSLKLVPEGAAATTYCQRRTQGALNVVDITFENAGTADYAGGDPVSVRFGDAITRGTIPAIAMGDTATIAVPIPAACFSPDCAFTISWSNQPEVEGLCPG